MVFPVYMCEYIIRTRYDFRTLTRFPVELYSPELDRNISGYASLDLSEELVGFSSSSDSLEDEEVAVSQIFIANGISIPYRYRVPLDWDNESFPTAHINADMDSELLRQVGSYLLTPISQSEGLIVLSPSNPNSFTYTQELLYSECVNSHVLQVMVAVQTITADSRAETLSPVGQDEFHRCSIVTGNPDEDDDTEHSFAESTWISPNAWEVFSRELERHGLISSPLGIGHNFEGPILLNRQLVESVIDLLPSFQFFVQLVDGYQASVFVIEPREYFAFNNDQDQEFVELNVFSSHIPFCELGQRFLRRTVVHVDSINHRIGFGDPLIEI